MKKLLLRFVLLTATASVAFAADPKNNDEVVMREFQTRMKDIQTRALATDDFEQRRQAQQEVRQLFESTLPKLSDELRPMLMVSFKVVTPLQERSAEYLGEASKFFSSGAASFTELKSRKEIATRVEKIAQLTKLNTELLAAINRLESEVARILDESKVTGANRVSFLAGFNQSMGRTIGPMRAIRTLDTEIFTRLGAAFRMLEKHWGKWTANAEGAIEWQDAATEAEFTKLQNEIQELAQRQATAEQQLSERL